MSIRDTVFKGIRHQGMEMSGENNQEQKELIIEISQLLGQAHELEILQQQTVHHRGDTMHPDVRHCLDLQVKINRKTRQAQDKMLNEMEERLLGD